MNPKSEFKRNVSGKKAKAILAKSDIHVSEQRAVEILDLMYFLAELVVRQNIKL